jgi:hypothetical protein
MGLTYIGDVGAGRNAEAIPVTFERMALRKDVLHINFEVVLFSIQHVQIGTEELWGVLVAFDNAI